MIRSNVEEIRAYFASLIFGVQLALEENSNVDDVRKFLVTYFRCDFSTSHDLKGLLCDVTSMGLWDYQYYSPLEKLANSLLSNNSEVKNLISAYKAHLSGFYLVERLIHFLSVYGNHFHNDDEPNLPILTLTTVQFKKIQFVLELDRKISQLSLEYAQDVWQSFQMKYKIPSLTVLLNAIISG